MKTVICCILSMSVIAVHSEAVHSPKREVLKLTLLQMDAITAGTVVVSADAVAGATGEGAVASTSTTTVVASRRSIERAYGEASAFAYGDSRLVGVSFGTSADGNVSATTGAVYGEGNVSTSAVAGWVSVTSVDVPKANVATADAFAFANGSDTLAETYTFADTDSNSSLSVSGSTSLSQ